MGLIGSILMGVAGQVFRAGRDAYQRSSEESARAEAAIAALPNAVTEARAQSDKLKLTGKASFAQHFQAQIAKATDTDADGKISSAELQKQVNAGGGSDAQAKALFKALDKNGDGTVTTDEFKDGIPVPSTALAQQILQMVQAHREARASGQDAPSAEAIKQKQAQGIDAASVLSRLAAQLPQAQKA